MQGRPDAVIEWGGPSPWLDRMQGLVRDVFKHAPSKRPPPVPSETSRLSGTCSKPPAGFLGDRRG